MLNHSETANIVQLLEDFHQDLLNGNVPAAKLLVVSLVNNLTAKEPLDWARLGDFVIAHLETREFRFALLHLLPKVHEIISPVQPGQEAETAC
ncbi:hypothetical protein ES703_78442 [subsurface metagenome]